MKICYFFNPSNEDVTFFLYPPWSKEFAIHFTLIAAAHFYVIFISPTMVVNFNIYELHVRFKFVSFKRNGKYKLYSLAN